MNPDDVDKLSDEQAIEAFAQRQRKAFAKECRKALKEAKHEG